ncbi:hypothetical protein KBH77_00825 [Patescibacteria group bacterium]|nr:hypothetical protein [Patescibacteria group bacterium]
MKGEKFNNKMKRNKDFPPALVLELSATGLAVGRILNQYGVEVYGVDFNNYTIGQYSKYIKKPFGGIIFKKKSFLSSLINFSKRFELKPVLIPCSDRFIELVSENFDILKQYYNIQDSLSPLIAPIYLNKREFYKLCEKFKINFPKTIYITGEETVSEIVRNLRFPMILKPYLIHKWKKHLKGQKVILIENIKQLDEIFSREKVLLKDSMLQEVIPGPEGNIYLFKGYFDKSGKNKAYFTGRKIRQYPPNFGSASLAESITNKDVKTLSIEFLENVGFKGLCGTEYKYDPRDKIYKMIEVNIRPQLWEDLTRIAEKDILWSAYCDLAGLGIPEQRKQIDYVRWVYFARDIYSAFYFIKNQEYSFIDIIKSYKNLKCDAIIDFKDPKTLIGVPIYVLSQLYFYKASTV